MLFYDFEVFEEDWLVVILDMDSQSEHVIVNDADAMREFYESHKGDIWCGYNSRHYDRFILKAILCGFEPKEVSDFIIVQGNSGYRYSNLFSQIALNDYDIMQGTDKGLKWLEGSMGHSIVESSVPFDIERKLTAEELEEVVSYCRNDVMETVEVFIQRKSDFDAQMGLLKMFEMPLSYISKTKVQLSAEILGARRVRHDDEFDVSIPPTARVEKYTDVVRWFEDPANHRYRDGTKSHKLETVMAGVPMTFAWGGVHGAIERYCDEGWFVNMDVGSLYPSIDIIYHEHCFSRACGEDGRERYIDIKRKRMELKHAGKKKEQAPLKIVLNGTYGAKKDRHNKLYDPRSANNTCVFGQILVGVDLFERLEQHCKIVQVNTDGILVKLDRYEDYGIIDDVAHEWELRTGLNLDFDDYGWGKLWQKDVNNYLILDEWGHWKSKGAYVKELSPLDNDLPIVNRAVVDYMVKGIQPEQTIGACSDLMQFQMVCKISGKYSHIQVGRDGEPIAERCVRLFASTDSGDGTYYKMRATTGKLAKMQNCPEHAFADNGSVVGKRCPAKLDRRWYVDLSLKRLRAFGVRI